jgi:hypothetical protein
MNWIEQKSEILKARTGAGLPVDSRRANELAEGREICHGQVLREKGQEGTRKKGFEKLSFQPVVSKGFYEAEFAVRGEDVIFHIWPYGYRKALDDRTPLPKFPKAFQNAMLKAFGEVFGSHRLFVDFDRDMGSFFVRADNFKAHPHHHELSVQACRKLHKALGGVEG